MEQFRITGLWCALVVVAVGCQDNRDGRGTTPDDRAGASCPLDLPQPPADTISAAGDDPGELIYASNSGFAALYDAVSGGACSQGDYSNVDYCYNTSSPQRPSLLRALGRARMEDDQVANVFEGGHARDQPWHRPGGGETQELPGWRTSVDGRLLWRPGHKAWPKFHFFRPGRMGHDLQTLPIDGNYPAELSEVYSAISKGAEVHRLAHLNPQDTALNFEMTGDISALHTTLCESSPPDTITADPRTPVPCTARYGTFTYPSGATIRQDNAVREGLCYQISLLGGVTEDLGNNDLHWELRSASYTVFVEGALRDDVRSGEVWVYPQDPDGAVSSTPVGDVVDLPDFAAYDLAKWWPWNAQMPNPQDIGAVDAITWTTPMTSSSPSRTETIDSRCYSSGLTPAAGAPAWCEYLYNQSRAPALRFDMDRDASVDRPAGTSWDGLPGNGSALFEPTTTADGRVLMLNENRGLFYAVTNGDPCDATGFTDFQPISSMPIDPRMSSYPIAQTGGQPFRDSAGEPLAFGSYQRFAYAWLDRSGTNMLLALSNDQRDQMTVGSYDPVLWDPTLGGTPSTSEFNTSRLQHGEPGAGHQVAALGAWTRHKMVVLDGGANASDFGGSGANDGGVEMRIRYTVPLYANASLRFIPKSVTQIQSFEHMFGAYEALRPMMPFDVVWTMGVNNGHNAEVAFDEYMHPDAHIVAHMNAAVRVVEDELSGAGTSAISVEDGFSPQHSSFAESPNFRFQTTPNTTGVGKRAILQNAAGDSSVNDLRVRGGARIEPVALGGVLGKGLWLDGDNDFVDAGYPRTSHHNWYAGVWIDARESGSGPVREVFHFSDGSFVGYRWDGARMHGVVHDGNGTTTEVEFPAYVQDETFFHYAVRLTGTASARDVQFVVDGNALGSVSAQGGLDVMAGSDPWTWMTLGAPNDDHDTPHGWLDEWRVYSIDPAAAWFDEFQCNIALGTLVDPSLAGGGYRASHLQQRDVSLSALGVDNGHVCEQLVIRSHDRPSDLAPQHGHRVCADRVHQGADENPACLRTSFIEQPALQADAARPDSHRPFCDGCHVAGTQVEGLKPEALDAGGGARFEDIRRQPMDPPPVQALPPTSCQPDDTINGNWLAAWAIARSPQPDGTYTTDHVIDGGELLAHGTNSRYIPPSRPLAATCSDQVQNGDEDGVDCGGSSCAPCCSCVEGEEREIGTHCAGGSIVTEFEVCSSCQWVDDESVEVCDPGMVCDPVLLSCRPCDPAEGECALE